MIDAQTSDDGDKESSGGLDLVRKKSAANKQKLPATYPVPQPRASATLPSMRWAIENRSPRCCSNVASLPAWSSVWFGCRAPRGSNEIRLFFPLPVAEVQQLKNWLDFPEPFSEI